MTMSIMKLFFLNLNYKFNNKFIVLGDNSKDSLELPKDIGESDILGDLLEIRDKELEDNGDFFIDLECLLVGDKCFCVNDNLLS
jgi:hypothetical protein